MAYFSNGSEGEYYEAKYCAKCVHQPENPDDGGCALMLAHLLHNYDQHDKVGELNAVGKVLSILWPRKGAYNGECSMFIPRERLTAKKEPATDKQLTLLDSPDAGAKGEVR